MRRQNAVSILAVLLAVCSLARAQESQLGADFRLEGERFKKTCGQFSFKKVPGCAQVLFTDHPMHIAVGSIAPQNGFGAGVAFVSHYTPNESWRWTWNVDAVGTPNASWRAGAYMKLIHTPPVKIVAVRSTGAPQRKSKLKVREYTVFNLYSQSISLNKLFFYGIGNNTLHSSRTAFGMQESIVGANVVKPLWDKLALSVSGEINGRMFQLRGAHVSSTPSIENVHTEATAPGLLSDQGFVQFGEGLRIKPVLFNDHLLLNYSVNFQQFIAPSSPYSFRRLTTDIAHEIPLFGFSRSQSAREFNGPNECGATPGNNCPAITSLSHDRKGTLSLRFIMTQSIAGAGNSVPYYLQPTLGGSDINGTPALGSYEDYRFRAPNFLLFREGFEHGIWGPLGVAFLADQGKVATRRGDLDFKDLKHSFSAGVTVRAGGLPMMQFMFSWGGGEGTHTTATVDTSLMGGSRRPSLF